MTPKQAIEREVKRERNARMFEGYYISEGFTPGQLAALRDCGLTWDTAEPWGRYGSTPDKLLPSEIRAAYGVELRLSMRRRPRRESLTSKKQEIRK